MERLVPSQCIINMEQRVNESIALLRAAEVHWRIIGSGGPCPKRPRVRGLQWELKVEKLKDEKKVENVKSCF